MNEHLLDYRITILKEKRRRGGDDEHPQYTNGCVFPFTISISNFDTKHNLTNCITTLSRIPSTRTPRSHSRYQPPSHHHHHLWKSSSLILFGSTPPANQNCIFRPCRCHSTCSHLVLVTPPTSSPSHSWKVPGRDHIHKKTLGSGTHDVMVPIRVARLGCRCRIRHEAF